jgi:septum formation protein
MAKFVLASASPARRRLLQLAGIEPVVYPSSFDESQVQISEPAKLVETLALGKAQIIAAQLQANQKESWVILGCDSVLRLNQQIHGKPANPEEAFSRWQQMRGQVGELYTGHVLIHLPLRSDPLVLVRHQVTRVYFAPVSDREISAYIATGEPLNCAGCFALEGRGGLLVEKIEGCHSNVIGLSLPLLRHMLQELGFEVTQFWADR